MNLPSRIQCFCKQTLCHVIVAIVPWVMTPLTFPVHAKLPPTSSVQHSWQFENGAVVLSDPLRFGDKMLLRQPQLLGSGGGGAVFAMKQDDRMLALKTSWASSTESVVNECRVLQFLEEQHVTGVERCLGTQSYDDTHYMKDDALNNRRRVMILLEPVMEGPIAASLSELSSQLQQHAIQRILQTMFQILSANVTVADVQMLISQETGDVLFIDFSEARVLSSSGTMSFMEQALLSNFIQEVSSMIPDDQTDFAADIVAQLLKEATSARVHRSEQTLALLKDQFLGNEAFRFSIDK